MTVASARGRNVRNNETLSAGTWVRIKRGGYRHANPAAMKAAVVLRHDGNLLHVQTHGSNDLLITTAEIVVLSTAPQSAWAPMRHRLPYGMWTCADGRQVLFNRDYKPIWQRLLDKPAQPADINERVKFIKQEWFYTDSNPPWEKAATQTMCEAILSAWC